MNKITYGEMLQLKRWNTPTIYNGLEMVTEEDLLQLINKDDLTDFMPQMGPMIGRAVTVTIQPSNKEFAMQHPDAWIEYREYLSGISGPKIVVIQDLDKPQTIGSFWGEVSANFHKALGCIGTIVDGAVRDVDEMTNAGFKALAKRFCVGHGYSTPISWGEPVSVFGTKVKPGQLVHADKHGFIVIPEEDENKLLEAVIFQDSNECLTKLPASRLSSGVATDELLKRLQSADAAFSQRAMEQFARKGE